MVQQACKRGIQSSMKRWIRVAALAALVTSCATPKPTTPPVVEDTGASTSKSGGGTPRPVASKPVGVYATPVPPTPRPTATPTPAPTPTPTPPPLVNLRGAIVDATDQVVENAAIKVFAPDGDGAVIAEGKSDALGNFVVEVPRGKPFNVEASEGERVGFKAGVRVGVPSFQITIAKGSKVLGKVSAPKAPAVTDFSGVVVTIPGSPYKATALADGSYEIPNVPAGTFDIFASKEGLGSALGANVQVRSNQVALVGLLSFDVTTPKIVAVAPASGGVGAEFRVSGSGFGQAGAPVQISVGGVAVVAPTRLSDTTLVGTVPVGAKSGEVLVKIGELPSNPGSFQVIKTLTIAALDGPLLVGGTRTYVATAKDEAGATITGPSLDWSTSTATLVEVKAGFVKALAVGDATIAVRSGEAVGTLSVLVAPFLATVATLAGSTPGHQDGDGMAARFKQPAGLLIGDDGELYLADAGDHRIRRVTRAGAATTIAGDGTAGYVNADGAEARFDTPLALGRGATLLVAESGMPGLRAIDLAAAGKPVTAFAGDGTVGDAEGPRADARFTEPAAIVVSPDGTYVADAGAHRIRLIAADGTVTTFAGAEAGFADGPLAAARFSAPRGLALAGDGSLFVADTGNHRIRQIKGGVVTTVAGGAEGDVLGLAAAARFKAPVGLAVATDGGLFIADSGNHRIKLLTPAGLVQRVAGAATSGAVEGTGDAARFNLPWGLAIDGAGVLYVADKENARIRKVTFTK